MVPANFIAKCKDRLVYKYVMHHSNTFMNRRLNVQQIAEPELIFVTYLPHFGVLINLKPM